MKAFSIKKKKIVQLYYKYTFFLVFMLCVPWFSEILNFRIRKSFNSGLVKMLMTCEELLSQSHFNILKIGKEILCNTNQMSKI
jgi:hypothetical protein